MGTNSFPEAVKRLRLVYAFKGYAVNIKDCLVVSREKELGVVDDEDSHCSCFSNLDTDRERGCLIHNPDEDEIVLLSIDNKFIKNHAGGVADCAVFNKLLFCFIEFKSNATGNTGVAINGTYQKAISQLKETLHIFKERIECAQKHFGIHTETDIRCHIIVSVLFPRSRAVEQTYQLAFAQDTGIALSFENEITFHSVL